MGRSWSNWFGNQRCEPRRIETARTEAAVQEAVARASREGISLRVVGGAHSLPPVVNTDGVILDARLGGPVQTDRSTMRATVPAGRRLHEIFDPLWSAGVTLKNMGELDTAALTGAVSTGVHGTGITLQCISASVREVRLVTASGEILEISAERDAELLRAAQISLGMLGVMTQVTIEVLPAYELYEHSFFFSVDEALERWDELLYGHRHYSFFYLPHPATKLYAQLPSVPEGVQDICYGTIRDAIAPDEPEPSQRYPGERRDRMNRILTYTIEPNFREIEFAVPLEQAKDTFVELRHRLITRYPNYIYPVDLRFVAEDDAYLSWLRGGPKVVFSIPEHPEAGYQPVLQDMEELFDSRGGLPHWGKEHTLTVARLQRLQPGFERFREIRRELDPAGTFLNNHLRELFE